MKIFTTFCFAFLAASLASAQEETPYVPEKPGAHHEHLKKTAGTWNFTMKSYGNPAQPMEGKGVQVARMMPGGFWLIDDHKFNMSGMTLHGHGVTGYDQGKNRYVGTWCDSMTSTIMTSIGSCSEDGKVLTMIGEHYNIPLKQVLRYRQVTTLKDENNKTFQMYHLGEKDQAQLMLEIVYTRRQLK